MATKFLIAAGEKMHLLAHAKGVIDSSPATATEFPATHLHDSIPSLPSKFSVAQGHSFFDVDLNLKNTEGQIGDMEVWDADGPVGFTKEAGAVATEITTFPIEGNSTLQLRGAGYFDYDVPTGALVAIAIKMSMKSGGVVPAEVQVADLYTRDFLQPDGTWSAAETALWTEDSESILDWRQKGIRFTMRPFSSVKRDVTRLRVRLKGGASAGDEGFFDDLVVVVVPNFFSVHGHNVPVKADGRLSSSANSDLTNTQLVGKTINNVFTLRDAQTLATFNQPSFYYWLKDNCPLFKGAGRYELTSVTPRPDSKKVTVSLWLRPQSDVDDAALENLFTCTDASDNLILRVWRSNTGNNVIELQIFDPPGTFKGRIRSTGESMPPNIDTKHVVFSLDTTLSGADPTRAQVFINRVSSLGLEDITEDTVIPFNSIAKVIWGGSAIASELNGSLNECYVEPDFSEDLTVGANLNKFHSTGIGRPDLGSDGSTPSGAAAWLYQYGTQENPITDFAINHGDGGGPFTVVGTVESELMFGSSRFWRFAADLIFTGAGAVFDDPPEAIEYGQLVFGRVQELLQQRIVPHAAPRRRPAVGSVSRAGNMFREALAQHDSRALSLIFQFLSLDRLDQWIEIRDRTAGGTRPVVIVADDTKGEVNFGYLSLDFDEEMEQLDQFHVAMDFVEEPFAKKLG